MIESARRYILDTVASMWEAQVQQTSALAERSMRARLAITHAIRQSIAVVDKLFNARGTNAIHHSVGLERFFRDLHVHGQHISGLYPELRVRRVGPLGGAAASLAIHVASAGNRL